MTPGVAMLVLASAVLHASWNALLKGGIDRLRSATAMAVGAGAVSAVVACLLPAPRAASWGCVGLSAALYVVYNLLLVTAYRHGDLGVSYPVARGSSPLLVAMGAAVAAGEELTPPSLAGIALISLGIAALAIEGGAGSRRDRWRRRS